MSSKRLEQLFQFLEENPGDSFLLFALAKEYENLENWPKALEYYLQITRTDPGYVGTYYHLGKLYEFFEQPEEAFAIYRKGMEVAQAVSDQHAYSELAAAKLNLGDDEDFA